MPAKMRRDTTRLRTTSSLSNSLLRVYFKRHCDLKTYEYQGSPCYLTHNDEIVELVKIEPHADVERCSEWTLTFKTMAGQLRVYKRRSHIGHTAEVAA